MKTVAARQAGILALALGAFVCVPALAQQTGSEPIPTSPPPAAEPTTPEPPAESTRSEAAPATASATPPPAAAAPAPTRPSARNGQTSLLIEVEGGRPDLRISVAIYSDAETFGRGEQPVRVLTLAGEGPVSRAFQLGLPPGRYAIIAWQDADGDGKPTPARSGDASEPTGYSGDADARSGPPRFDDAAFELGASGVTQRITLRGS